MESADYVRSQLTARITPPDSGETFVYSQGNIISLEGLSWEVAFGGGMGRPSGYRLALSEDLETIKVRLARIERAEVRLEVAVNSEVFYPHVGRVRGVSRDGRDPNRITLSVFDRLLDDDPKLPAEALTDSWASVHPEDLDLGYALYYGLHHRPFYHAAVSCDLATLLGPRNVSSENHVNSVFFNSLMADGDDVSLKHNLLLNKTWNQQSGSDNSIAGGYPFEVKDAEPSEVHFWKYSGSARDVVATNSFTTVFTQSRIGQVREGNSHVAIAPPAHYRIFNVGNQINLYISLAQAYVELRTPVRVFNTTRINISAVFSISTASGYDFDLNAGGASFYNQSSWGGPYSVDSDFDVASTGISLFQDEAPMHIGGSLTSSGFGHNVITAIFTYQLNFQLASENYRRYSAFSPVVNSADVAISENPLAILDDVFSHHSGTPFVAGQSSDAQVDVQSYAFQCFFAEREPLFGNGGIVDAFGEIVAAYLWIGDSGMVNQRVYQESAGAGVDRIVATSHMLDLSLQQDPLGVTAFDSQQASRFEVRYDYDFQTGQYRSSVAAGPASNALCQSADAAGVKGELERETRYILSGDVASYYLGHLVRIHGQGQEYAELTLPAQFFGIELADVLRVQHPMIAGSEALYRVVRVAPDYLAGTVAVRAGKILQADGS